MRKEIYWIIIAFLLILQVLAYQDKLPRVKDCSPRKISSDQYWIPQGCPMPESWTTERPEEWGTP